MYETHNECVYSKKIDAKKLKLLIIWNEWSIKEEQDEFVSFVMHMFIQFLHSFSFASF